MEVFHACAPAGFHRSLSDGQVANKSSGEDPWKPSPSCLAIAVTDRLADFEADLLHVHVDFPLFQRLALPIPVGRSKIPGIKIQDARMILRLRGLATKIERCSLEPAPWPIDLQAAFQNAANATANI
jgi:hypothetical protein